MTIPVIYKSYRIDTPHKGFWDYAMINDLFEGRMWKRSGYDFEIFEQINLKDSAVDGECGILIIPARSHANPEDVEKINKDIEHLSGVILMLIGDEEGVFPYLDIKHPNCKIYAMSPQLDQKDVIDFPLPNGYTPGLEKIDQEVPQRSEIDKNDWFFAGQVTHNRRKACVKELRKLKKGCLIETDGFSKGIDQKEYYKIMAQSKVALCPSGAVIPDTFRLYEALECASFPIVEEVSPKGAMAGYWQFLFNEDELPFKIVKTWKGVEGQIQYFSDTYPKFQNVVSAWWMGYKRRLYYQVIEDFKEVLIRAGKEGFLNSLPLDDCGRSVDGCMTVLIPTSPTKLHPDTSLIEVTIESVREKLPHSEIILMVDGVREEQQALTPAYNEYIRRLLWLTNHKYKNILPVLFESHQHQANMTRECLRLVKTDYIMFVEHDTPLCEEIPFGGIVGFLATGRANLVRLNHEAFILDEHKKFLLDKVPVDLVFNKQSMKLSRTFQWSQRPHVARRGFYEYILDKYFSEDSKTMIEDRMHGVVMSKCLARGLPGWNEFKIWIYTPEGDQKRSYHTDGRGTESKFTETFKF